MIEAAVTGMGCICSLGKSVPDFWGGLIAGKTGISNITAFPCDHLRSAMAGEVKLSEELMQYARKRGIKSRIQLFLRWALDEAITDRDISSRSLEDKTVGLVVGTSLGMSLVRESLEVGTDHGEGEYGTLEGFSDYLNETADACGIHGEVLVISTACASGANAIGIAKDMIALEGYDMVVCGGVDSLDRMKYLGHSALNTLTQTSIRPFSPRRDGTLFGEGAGILVLEKSSALGAGAGTPYAACIGTGYSCDAHHFTAPDPDGKGAARVMREALHDAGISPEDVGYINLHGSGTYLNDSMEAGAIQEVFGQAASRIPLSSIKPAIGHAMGAAGALEAIATVLSVKRRKIPPTLNLDPTKDAFSSFLINRCAEDATIRYAVSNSFGFGGCNGAVVFSRWEETI
jgi:3-oxoacyl-[acyl-carrier-protein] synthase II